VPQQQVLEQGQEQVGLQSLGVVGPQEQVLVPVVGQLVPEQASYQARLVVLSDQTGGSIDQEERCALVLVVYRGKVGPQQRHNDQGKH
jgi:hypothetical protein